MSLTTVPDINKLILLNVTDKTLFKLENNDEVKSITNNSYWVSRFKVKYGVALKVDTSVGKSIMNIYIQLLDKSPKFVFNFALKEDYVILIKHLLEKGLKVNKDKMLLETAKNGHLEIVKYLVENGVNIHANINDASLILASENGHPKVVKYLVEHGANIHTGNGEALSYASYHGKLEVVKYLVENGADIHAQDDRALMLASSNDHLEVVKYLVENGANIHARNDEALIYASGSGYIEVVKYLVENGADIHAGNDLALILASERGKLKVVKYLVENDADITKADLTKDKIKNYITKYQNKKVKEPKVINTDTTRCQAITKAGTQCKNKIKENNTYCHLHLK